MNKTLSDFIEKFKCALCDCEITNDTDSKEHVIPQSIGGRLKVKGFICKVCNNTKGDSWDAELARLLNFFSLFLGISRERGEPPSQLVRHMDTNGNFRELVFLPDGSYKIPKPIYKVTNNGDVPQLSIQAANKNQFKQLLGRAKKQFPKLDADHLFNKASVEHDFSQKIFNTSIELIDDVQSGKSAIKSCLALAAYHGIKPQNCLHGLDYLKNSEAKPCFGYFYERDLVLNRPNDTVFHCVAITGNNQSKQLFGYIEYFGIHRIVAILSDNYEGEDFSHVHAINPVTSEYLDIEIDMSFSKNDIEDILQNNQLPLISKGFAQIMPIIQAKRAKDRIDSILDVSIEYAFANCGAKKDELLTEEQLRKLQILLINKFQQLI